MRGVIAWVAFVATSAGAAARRRLADTMSAPTPDCALYVAGPILVSEEQLVGRVDTFQNYELDFTMELASDFEPLALPWVADENGDILKIGPTVATPGGYPGILLGGGGIRVHVNWFFCTSCDSNYYWNLRRADNARSPAREATVLACDGA